MSTGYQTGHRIEEKFICRTTPRRAYTVLPNACKCRSSDTSGSLGSHNSRGGLGGSHASMCSKSQRRDSGGQGTVQRKKSQSKHNSTHFAYDQNEYRHSPQQCPTSATAQCESATRQDSTSGATQGFYMRALPHQKRPTEETPHACQPKCTHDALEDRRTFALLH